jgi:hypothetical protein
VRMARSEMRLRVVMKKVSPRNLRGMYLNPEKFLIKVLVILNHMLHRE